MSFCSICWSRQRQGRLRGGKRRVCQACRGPLKSKLYNYNLARIMIIMAKYSYSTFFLVHSREKPASMMDEDFNCSSVCIGNVLSSSLPSAATPGLACPPFVATPFDHDYAKRKTLRRQQWQQQRHEEQQADGTVQVLDTVSGVGLFDLSALGQEAHRGALQSLITMLNGFPFSSDDPHAPGDWDVVKWAIWLLII